MTEGRSEHPYMILSLRTSLSLRWALCPIKAPASCEQRTKAQLKDLNMLVFFKNS